MSNVFRRSTSTSPKPVGSGSAKEVSSSPTGTVRTISDFREQVKKGISSTLDTSTLSAVVDAVRNTEGIDDRKLLLEHALVFVSRLPEGKASKALQNRIIELLYNDLAHPPATCIGDKYAWRTADGSFNNVTLPDMGKAGTPYARSVQQTHPVPKHELPDAGLIFDTLLKREKFKEHPAGLSSLMFAFAALVIHSVFRTSHEDVNVNMTSSYVDLAPLYGNNEADQDKIREKDGTGHLLPDVFAEDRLLLLPPAVCALLVLFSRNHNYIATKLYEINERRTFKDPSTLSGDDLAKQDEELFQTARLVNCGWFGSVVFSDYFSSILGLVRQGSSWSLDPFGEIRQADHSVFERGKGNICSVEFNCLYRWHATTSEADQKWVDSLFDKVFDGKNPDDVTPADFKAAAGRIQKETPDIENWTFGNLKRNQNGSFKDDDLAMLIHTATENPAGAFGARHTPPSMRLHEMMGIEQNRRWGVCSLNDFREYLGLKTYSSFLEWNSDPEIANAAEKLYGNIQNLELYVGLQAEEAKPVVEGAGLCPGYTISRAILSDAIALTRGDRFFTYDFTPFNLTAWGFNDCQRDPNAFGFGSTLGRLFLRTLPNHFSENSVYTFFPLMTPKSMKGHLKTLGVAADYDVKRPVLQTPLQVVTEYSAVKGGLASADLVSPYSAKAKHVIKGDGFYIVEGQKQQADVATALTKAPGSSTQIEEFFFSKTQELVRAGSFSLVGKNVQVVDVIRDVAKPVAVHWVAGIAGITLKTKDSDGSFEVDELYKMLTDIYNYVFLQHVPATEMVERQKVQAHVKALTSSIQGLFGAGVSRKGSVLGLISLATKGPKKAEHHNIVEHLGELGYSNDRLTNAILALMVGTVGEMSIALTNMINLFIEPEHHAEVRGVTADQKASLEGHIREALRLDPPFRGVYRTNAKTNNQLTFLDIAEAGVCQQTFPNPQALDAKRTPIDLYFGSRLYQTLGEGLTIKILSAVMRGLMSFPAMSRGPGQSGVLKRFVDHARPDLRYAYLDEKKRSSPWPTSMKVQFSSA